MSLETVFTMETSNIKYGVGATREVGADLRRFAVARALVVTDRNLRDSTMVETVLESCRQAGVETTIFDGVRIEPTDESFKLAIAVAQEVQPDGFVAVGGGSVIDTAKAANLYASYPTDDLLDYVNAPIGRAKPIPGPVKPLIAVPTTAGTGSETTGVAIFDLVERHVKTGISHRFLRPVMGVVDPLNTATMPPLVAASTGLDVLSHAIESLTSVPYNQRPAPERPDLRPPYQGANPISDVWSSTAIRMVAAHMTRAITDPSDVEARGQMLLAAAFAGIGFGNAGVHLPHAMSYPVAGMVRSFRPAAYHVDHPLVPHGMAVILNAPAVFRWTAEADPHRHLWAAELLGADVRGADASAAGELLAQALIKIMRDTGMPNGLEAVGFTADDAEALADGAFAQQRLTKLSPRPASRDDLAGLFRAALRYW
ncbi:MAG: iron-containing alcohol dehydrogenase [Chloroflexi bacterium]|nr:iron-containing alcohol dehydrogenase [Chloroflexota bacterium]